MVCSLASSEAIVPSKDDADWKSLHAEGTTYHAESHEHLVTQQDSSAGTAPHYSIAKPQELNGKHASGLAHRDQKHNGAANFAEPLDAEAQPASMRELAMLAEDKQHTAPSSPKATTSPTSQKGATDIVPQSMRSTIAETQPKLFEAEETAADHSHSPQLVKGRPQSSLEACKASAEQPRVADGSPSVAAGSLRFVVSPTTGVAKAVDPSPASPTDDSAAQDRPVFSMQPAAAAQSGRDPKAAFLYPSGQQRTCPNELKVSCMNFVTHGHPLLTPTCSRMLCFSNSFTSVSFRSSSAAYMKGFLEATMTSRRK